MLSLVLRGKLAVTEDVLTAAVFDALTDCEDRDLLRAILCDSRSVDGTLDLPLFDAFTIDLWPRTAAGEPDVRIRLSREGAQVATVLVEAKLGAGKSGVGWEEGDSSAPRVRDQLARYLLDEVARDPTITLVYLTHHLIQPAQDLQESASYLVKVGRPDLVNRLFWAPWRSIEQRIAETVGLRPSFERVRRVLRSARMFWFAGISHVSLQHGLGAPAFYRTIAVTYAWPTRSPGGALSSWCYSSPTTAPGRCHEITWPRLSRTLDKDTFYQGRA